MDVWKGIFDSIKGDFTGCYHKATGDGSGTLGDCAWAATWLPLGGPLGKVAEAMRGVDAALRSGEGITGALKALKALAVDAEALADIEHSVDVYEELRTACPVNSFPGSTAVAMADDSRKAIRDVRTGDRLLAADPGNWRSRAEPVTRTFHHTAVELIDIALNDGGHEKSSLGYLAHSDRSITPAKNTYRVVLKRAKGHKNGFCVFTAFPTQEVRMKRFDEADFGLTWLTTMFHADWTHNGATGAEAVRYHLDPDLEPEAVLAIRRDARSLLDNLDAATIETLWQAATNPGGAFSDPRRGFTSGPAWTATIVDLCDAWLAVRPAAPALTGPDTEDGAHCLDAVLAEIGRARLLPDGIRDALARCATGCTPDLALRLLLRAISEAGPRSSAKLSPDQYARLSELGSEMHYGEFLVSEVEYLVEQPYRHGP
ncbi:hypothetical protein [Streptomyces sp. Y20]|uniref:hypothetical protein n=1 Tax=Streptomyces sp. Y20 TaxID=3342391 RepID=UPI003722D20E